MTDEQDGLDASLVKRKLTKRERFRGVVQRVSKVKKSDEESTRDGDFTLNDDVKDFLAFRSPYSKPAAVLSSPPESQKPDTKLATPAASKTDVDEFLHATDPADALPHFPTPSRDPLPVPRIDVAKSPRFPQARDLLGEEKNAETMYALRIQEDSGSPPRRKARRKGLAVRFSDSPPIIIGEGGDDRRGAHYVPITYKSGIKIGYANARTTPAIRTSSTIPNYTQTCRKPSCAHITSTHFTSKPAEHGIRHDSHVRPYSQEHTNTIYFS
jgi:hypothetical protein